MPDITLEQLDAALNNALAPIRDRLGAIEPYVAGIPLIHRDFAALRHDVRQIKAAVNDLAALQMTAGEAEALHTDVDQTITKQRELEARVATLERLLSR